MQPTTERMNDLWYEMLRWPQAHRMSFACQLAHSCLGDNGSNLIDGGMYDAVAETDVYVVAGRGTGADRLKRAAAEIGAEHGDYRVVKVGEQPSPLCGEYIPQFIEPA